MNIADLEKIIVNFESGRWDIPMNSFLLQEIFEGEKVEYWREVFSKYEEHNFSKEQVVFSLKQILENLKSKSGAKGNIELVWTGPEALNSTLRDTAVMAQELFRGAKNEIVIVGFAFYQGKEIFKDLATKLDSDPSFSVTFFVDVRREGNTSAEVAVLAKFKSDFQKKQWPGVRLPEIYYDPRTLDLKEGQRSSMHAKCIIADSERILITSANFTQAAHHRNIEAGVVIDSAPFAVDLKSQFFNLAEMGYLKKL
ncbi:DISARM system phospholipase D-like protein DrmC [Bdellovibrio bacteriovorus]|uniref:DISARM system phospholipase D-like protein DrmC n=1 Tax=Bdellovibrio bacteriovorus TaxID=959 RepID=UPI003AA98079